MHRVRMGEGPSESGEQPPRRLPLRWAMIIATAGAAAVAAGTVGGLPAGIGAFFLVAGTLHVIVA